MIFQNPNAPGFDLHVYFANLFDIIAEEIGGKVFVAWRFEFFECKRKKSTRTEISLANVKKHLSSISSNECDFLSCPSLAFIEAAGASLRQVRHLPGYIEVIRPRLSTPATYPKDELVLLVATTFKMRNLNVEFVLETKNEPGGRRSNFFACNHEHKIWIECKKKDNIIIKSKLLISDYINKRCEDIFKKWPILKWMSRFLSSKPN